MGEGAMAGNDVCSDIDYASVNGQVAWGDLQYKKKDLSKYPYPMIDVDPNKCYRMRFIMMASNAENYIINMAGHEMTLIALDGVPVRPLQITSLNMHIGERADVIMCTDQTPGYYSMDMTYDYACSLTPGHFIPPGFHAVSSCHFNAFLRYSNLKPWPLGPRVPTSPSGTGGGSNPKPVHGVPFDLTNPGDWNKTSPVKTKSKQALSETLALAQFGNGIVAIVAGQIAQAAASSASPSNITNITNTTTYWTDLTFHFGGDIVPFDCSAFVLICCALATFFLWDENYGAKDLEQKQQPGQETIATQWKNALLIVLKNNNVLLCGIISASFEAAMYLFVILWTPALTSSSLSGSNESPPCGLIFSTFMVCCMAGSCIFSCVATFL